MIRYLIILMFIFAFGYAQAQPSPNDVASFKYENMTLKNVVEGSLQNYLDMDYIADNEFLNDDRTITMHLKNYKLTRFKDLLIQTIKSYDYEVIEDGNLIKIWKTNYRNKITETQSLRGVGLQYIQSDFSHTDTNHIDNSLDQLNQTIIDEPEEPINLYVHQLNNTKPSEIQSALGNLFDESQITYSPNDILNDRIVFKGTEEQNQKLTNVLNSLDHQTDQVQVKAFLYELQNSHNKQNSIGAFLSLVKDTLKVSLNNAERLSNYIQLRNQNVNLVLSALDSHNDFKLISNPTIFVKNRKTGLINVGEEIPTLGSIVTNNNGQQNQSINYVKTGLTLQIEPTIFKQDIELNILHKITNALPNDTGINNTPKLVNRTFQTTIDTHDNDIILIGGLTENRLTKSSNGLGFFPFLNSKSHSKNNNELMLMLHVKRI